MSKTFWMVRVNGAGFMGPVAEFHTSRDSAIHTYKSAECADYPKAITFRNPRRIALIEAEMRGEILDD